MVDHFKLEENVCSSTLFRFPLKSISYPLQIFLSANLIFKKQWMHYKYLTNWKMKILKGFLFV